MDFLHRIRCTKTYSGRKTEKGYGLQREHRGSYAHGGSIHNHSQLYFCKKKFQKWLSVVDASLKAVVHVTERTSNIKSCWYIQPNANDRQRGEKNKFLISEQRRNSLVWHISPTDTDCRSWIFWLYADILPALAGRGDKTKITSVILKGILSNAGCKYSFKS